MLIRVQNKGNLPVLLVRMQTGAATVENTTELLQKLKMELPYDPVIPLLGIYPKKPEILIGKNICTLMSIVVFSLKILFIYF